MSLERIARRAGMPAKRTILRWARGQTEQAKEFRCHYTRAQEDKRFVIADQVLDIAGEADGDIQVKVLPPRPGETPENWEPRYEVVINFEAVRRSALRVKARKWLAGRLNPKVFGDRQTIESINGGPTGQVKAVTEDMDPQKATEIYREQLAHGRV